jgi:hypothetical protein
MRTTVATANRDGDYRRIQGGLANLGHEAVPASIANILKELSDHAFVLAIRTGKDALPSGQGRKNLSQSWDALPLRRSLRSAVAWRIGKGFLAVREKLKAIAVAP